MKASFVIVNYNRKDELLITLSKTKHLIRANESDFEIVVVDNASTDGSAEAVGVFPGVVLIKNLVNSGAPAWNLSFEKVRGKYFIILDDDSHIDYGLDKALQFLEENEDVGVLALNVTGGLYRTYEWKDMSERAGFVGCGAIFGKSVYDKIGGYTDWIFLYTNEWDLGLRTLQAGYKVIYFEKCKVTHRASTLHRTSKRLIVYSVSHELGLIYKYFPKKHRTLYLTRVFLNNLKMVFQYGIRSLPWYFTALQSFFKLKERIVHTPVDNNIQNLFKRQVWKTKPFLGIL